MPASLLNPENQYEYILHCARYKTAAAQVLPSATPTVINFNTADYDPYSEVTVGAGWVFTSKTDGVFLVSVTLQLESAAVANNQKFWADLYKNGVQFCYLGGVQAEVATTDFQSLTGSTIIQLAKNDTICVKALQNNAAARALTADALWNHISIARLGRYS